MLTTKSDLPERTRTTMVELLNARLADAIDRQDQCKQAHWNVSGANFYFLHLLSSKGQSSTEVAASDHSATTTRRADTAARARARGCG